MGGGDKNTSSWSKGLQTLDLVGYCKLSDANVPQFGGKIIDIVVQEIQKTPESGKLKEIAFFDVTRTARATEQVL
ncbi:hypothetical protein NC652_034145 [Populus alba x Populus x berolinensis]|nr:hypothetical protein NC652_034145 [Populus alba x Populus x berolinensis]